MRAYESGGVLTEVYKDGLSQSVKPIGTILSYLPRTVRLGLSKWEKWIINGEESLRLTGEALRDKVDKIPPEKLCEPESYVAVPAIQQIAYCFDSEILRDMYANLLASSMNVDKKWEVHPSFVDIIKQITPDEAKLLSAFPKNSGKYIPLVNCKIGNTNRGGYSTFARNLTLDMYYRICDNPNNMCAYIENLERLKIITIPDDLHITNDELYKTIENGELVKKRQEKVTLNEGQMFCFDRRLFYVTDFGINFINCCLGV